MYKIENQYLKIVVSSKGAELQSLFDKEMNKEVLWYGDEKFWKRHSPLLFSQCRSVIIKIAAITTEGALIQTYMALLKIQSLYV